MRELERERDAFEWQIGVWNRISDVYLREIDERFAPVVEAVVVLSSLTLMYLIDRASAAREIARVLRPGGRLIAAAWAGPEWTALAGVTTAHLPRDEQHEARRAVMDTMYPRGNAPRHFGSLTRFIIGRA